MKMETPLNYLQVGVWVLDKAEFLLAVAGKLKL